MAAEHSIAKSIDHLPLGAHWPAHPVALPQGWGPQAEVGGYGLPEDLGGKAIVPAGRLGDPTP